MENPKRHVSIKTVAFTYFGLLLLAMTILWAMNSFALELLQFAYFYPIGCLLYFFRILDSFYPLSHSTSDSSCLFYGYMVYLVIFILAFLLRRKRAFVTLLFIYVIILCLNISGCNALCNMQIS
jgi:hypothetical protein